MLSVLFSTFVYLTVNGIDIGLRNYINSKLCKSLI